MDGSILLTTLLTSTVVSGMVSVLASVLLQNKQFKNEYYRQLIGKRLLAYERAVALHGRLTPITGANIHYDDGTKGKAKMLVSFVTRDEADATMKSLRETMDLGVWLSGALYGIVRDLSKELSEVRSRFTYDGESPREAIEGEATALEELEKRYHSIGKLSLKMELQIRSDLSSMHEVKDFMKVTNKAQIKVKKGWLSRPS